MEPTAPEGDSSQRAVLVGVCYRTLNVKAHFELEFGNVRETLEKKKGFFLLFPQGSGASGRGRHLKGVNALYPHLLSACSVSASVGAGVWEFMC